MTPTDDGPREFAPVRGPASRSETDADRPTENGSGESRGPGGPSGADPQGGAGGRSGSRPDAEVPVREVLLAEIHVSHPDMVLADVIEAVPEVGIRVECETRAAPGGPLLFVAASAEEYGRFESALLADHTVSDPRVVAAFPDHRIYRVAVATDLELVPVESAALGARPLAVRAGGDCWIVRLRLFTRDALDAFREYCTERGVSYRVRELVRAESRSDEYAFGLTPGQRDTLRLAYEAGYFDVPRRVSQDDLADRLGVSASAVSQRLRRATAGLVAGTLAADEDAER